MKCIILAAGYATRLYPLTENFPKPLLPIGKSTIIDLLIDDLAQNTKIDEFIVISNHKFYNHFVDWKNNKSSACKITILDDGTVTNETRLGAVKDILLATETLNITDDVMAMAGDNVLDFSLAEFVDFADKKNASCVMCHPENDLARKQRTAIITIDCDNKITSYEEKPKCPKGNLAVPPFYIYKNGDINRIKEALDAGCGYDAPGSFAAWLSGKTEVFAWEMPGKRYDVGDKESYERVKEGITGE